MMRKFRNPEPETSKPDVAASMEPMAEGIATPSRGREWARMGREGLVAHAKKFIAKRGIGGRGELVKADAGLYQALRSRKLLDEVGLIEKRRNWGGNDREELIAFAKGFISDRGIRIWGELKRADGGLYQALRKRKLLDEVGLEGTRRWVGLDDGKLVALAKEFIVGNMIDGRAELSEANPALYEALRKRKLLNEVGLDKMQAKWVAMDTDNLLESARAFILERGISGRVELKGADMALYCALNKRKLLGRIGLVDKRRAWTGMDDNELRAYGNKFVRERGIGNTREFRRIDHGLYSTLRSRRLIGELEFPKKRGKWKGMEGKEIIAYARKLMSEKGISTRNGLANANGGLYEALRGRKLLDAVFARIESSRHTNAVNGVLDALDSFGDD